MFNWQSLPGLPTPGFVRLPFSAGLSNQDGVPFSACFLAFQAVGVIPWDFRKFR
jgi:hypothetical protein